MPRGSYGQGNAAQTKVDLTNSPSYPQGVHGSTDGEWPGTGSRHMATIHERMNKSNPRNQGPDRTYSPVLSNQLPIATKGGRHTGRVS